MTEEKRSQIGEMLYRDNKKLYSKIADVPVVGEPIVWASGIVCDLGYEYINKPSCDAIKDVLEERNLGELSAPSVGQADNVTGRTRE